MKRAKKFPKASILGVAAVSTLFTACDLINELIPAAPNPSDPQVQTSSSSQFVPVPIPQSSSAILPTSSFSPPSLFETWRGTDGIEQVSTGYDNGTETSGYWFTYGDDLDGGESRIIWPVLPGNEYNEQSLEPIVNHCKGVCGTASLRKGTLTYNPFVGIGFSIAGESPSGDLDAADISNMGGVCVSYASEVAPVLEMNFTDDVNARIDYANPAVNLPKSKTGTTKFIPWSDFKQPSWYKGSFKISGEQGAKQVTSLKFRFQASTGDFRFNITEVGSLTGCTGVPASLDFISQEIPPITPPDPVDPPIIPPTPNPNNNFETWFGNNGIYQINTGYDNGTETSGYWYSFSDDFDGGNSRIHWPVERGNEYSDDAMDPIIDYCGGLCGTAVLDKGYLTYNPFVGVGFNIAGETFNGEVEVADASAMGGVCITYTSTAAPTLELGLGEAMDAAIGYAQPAVALAKSTYGVTKFIPWSSFKQPSWYKGKNQVTGEQAAKHLANIKFKIQAAPGSYDFNIQAIGPFNGGTCGPTVAAGSK